MADVSVERVIMRQSGEVKGGAHAGFVNCKVYWENTCMSIEGNSRSGSHGTSDEDG